MPEAAIDEFFQKRKDDWLKKSIKPSMSDEEIKDLEKECAAKFSAEQWLPHAAKRISSRAFTTHPSKFSHPSTGIGKKNIQNHTYVTAIVCEAERKPDGYLRSGNAAGNIDSVGNAAELDVEEFLNLKMNDGKSLFQHIEDETKISKQLLTIQSASYQNLKDGFLAIAGSDSKNITSSKVKQVYFPVEDDYHLLSVLSNSGLIYELRRRIDDLRFSEKQKMLREKRRKLEYSEEGFSEIYDITTIGYGGTKPQNISVLNNQFGGKARLFLSAPPYLVKRDIRFPTSNFFINSIRYYDIQEPLVKLHKVFITCLDSAIPRRNLETGRDHRIEEILDVIIQRMTAMRSVAEEQYWDESSSLPHYQKIWLCAGYVQEREQQEEWLDQLCADIARWITDAYKKVVKKSVMLGPAEREYIKDMITTHREVLR